jgi:hypothetical protein
MNAPSYLLIGYNNMITFLRDLIARSKVIPHGTCDSALTLVQGRVTDTSMIRGKSCTRRTVQDVVSALSESISR